MMYTALSKEKKVTVDRHWLRFDDNKQVLAGMEVDIRA